MPPIRDYRGLFWRRPVIASIFTMVRSPLAGIPSTRGFLAFYVLAAGAASAWPLIFVLAVTMSPAFLLPAYRCDALFGTARTPSLFPIGARRRVHPGYIDDSVDLGGTLPAPRDPIRTMVGGLN